MSDAHKNFAVSRVAVAPSPALSGTSLQVTVGQGDRFPAVPFNAVVHPVNEDPDPLNAEIIRVTARTDDAFTTIVRTQEDSAARAITVGDRIYAAITAKTLTDLEEAFEDALAAVGVDVLHVCILPGSTLSNAFVWTNMPSAETILFNVNVNRFGLDLTPFTQMRWSFWLNVMGSAGAKLFVQWAATETGTYAAIDGAAGTELAIDSGGTARKRSGWVNLAAGARADVFVRIAGSGGDGVADPGFGSMYLEFR